MREILFRGKLKYTNLPHQKGDWVYGDYVKIKDGDRIMHNIYGYGEVIPETLGQYTGLNDKNGKRIFKGDICQNGERTYFICWISWQCAWGCCNLKTGRKTPTYQVISREGNNFEVVGNIHDNPELIGG